ncbi:MAG: tRNA-dihydrouridine synthase family protein [Trueperaceae bacterium]
MVSARSVALGDERSEGIGAPYPGEPDLVIQLFAADPDEAAIAAVRLQQRYRPAAFDLNMGCPVRKVMHKGCGVQLMRRPELAAAIVRAVGTATGLPVSTKMRLGPDAVIVDDAADAMVEAGAALVAVHGRTGVQKYAGEADWAPIAALAARLRVPVLGSGDVRSASDARMRRASGAGVMIARGALGRPWIFREVRGGPRPAWPEVARTVRRHARLQAEWYGEERGVRSLRAHLEHYVRPYAEAASLRDRLVRATTVTEVDRILASSLTTNGGVPLVDLAPRSAAPHESSLRAHATMPRLQVRAGVRRAPCLT